MIATDTLDSVGSTEDAGIIERIPEGGAVADGANLVDKEGEQDKD